MADHVRLPECALKFGTIEAELEHTHEFRDEVRGSLGKIDHEVRKLTGNGNKGRIDKLFDAVGEINTMIATHITHCETAEEVMEERITELKEKQAAEQKKVDDRLWSERLKIAGIVGLILIVNQLLGLGVS